MMLCGSVSTSHAWTRQSVEKYILWHPWMKACGNWRIQGFSPNWMQRAVTSRYPWVMIPESSQHLSLLSEDTISIAFALVSILPNKYSTHHVANPWWLGRGYLPHGQYYDSCCRSGYTHSPRQISPSTSSGCVTLNEKCEFSNSRVKFLGHIIDGEGVHTYPNKVEAIQ